MTDLALHAQGLRRTFRRRRGPERVALDGIDLSLRAGAVHGLLGANGAGKTTLCRIACTVLLPSAGTLTVHGRDVVTEAEQVRRAVGIVFGGDRGLYGRLSARENLQFWCSLYRVPRKLAGARVDELLDRLGLAGRADDLVETYSRGMKQRLHLARGLVADPPVLILDEPTVGMDPVSAHEFRRLMGELRTEGRTVLLTTHDMAEAQSLCDTVTFLDAGRIVGSGTPATVAQALLEGGVRVRIHEVAPDGLVRVRASLPQVRIVHDERTRSADLLVAPEDVEQTVAAVMAAGYRTMSTGSPSLEDVYLDLLGRRGDGGARGMDVS